MDKISIARLGVLHPLLRDEAVKVYEEIEKALTGRAKCRITQTFRTFKEQNDLYAQGRGKPGKIVTQAKGGQSMHNYGLAVDFCLLLDGKEISWDMKKDYDGDLKADWMEVVAIFKKYGWSWGGDWKNFKDYPHFEKTFGKKLADIQALYTQQKTEYLKF